jgi:glutathione peroxidase
MSFVMARLTVTFRVGAVVAGLALGGCGNTDDKTPEATPAKSAPASESPFHPNDVVLDHQVKTLDGSDRSLADYRGKALLVVNTASECGFTPQYAGLQQVYEQYRERGFEVLAFPSNDFGAQEPGSNDEIREFVDDKFEITFPMFDKVSANGPDKSPLYATLSEQTGEGIKGEVEWNFTKFVVDPKGRVVARFAPDVEPTAPEVITVIEGVLPKGGG